MVTVDVPYVPAQYTQVVQVESAQQTPPEVITLTQSIGSEKALQGCKDVETIVKDSAINELNPSYIVFKHLGYQVKNGDYNAPQSVKDSVKTSLLKPPAHGTLVPQSFNFWTYQGEDNFEGKDQATFLVGIVGKRYKVVVNYLVHEVVDDKAVPPACESVFPPSTAPSGGMTFDPTIDAAAFSSWVRIEALSNIIAATSSINMSFADLAGGAVGQAVGNTITLDDNAAGHNWFIDTTPWDNSEYLATSQLKGDASH